MIRRLLDSTEHEIPEFAQLLLLFLFATLPHRYTEQNPTRKTETKAIRQRNTNERTSCLESEDAFILGILTQFSRRVLLLILAEVRYDTKAAMPEKTGIPLFHDDVHSLPPRSIALAAERGAVKHTNNLVDKDVPVFPVDIRLVQRDSGVGNASGSLNDGKRARRCSTTWVGGGPRVGRLMIYVMAGGIVGGALTGAFSS